MADTKQLQPLCQGEHLIAKTAKGPDTQVQVESVLDDGSIYVSDGLTGWCITRASLAGMGYAATAKEAR